MAVFCRRLKNLSFGIIPRALTDIFAENVLRKSETRTWKLLKRERDSGRFRFRVAETPTYYFRQNSGRFRTFECIFFGFDCLKRFLNLPK